MTLSDAQVATIAEQWTICRKLVAVSDGHSSTDRDLRLAFYSGATLLLRLLHDQIATAPSIDGATAMLQGLFDESQRFMEAEQQQRLDAGEMTEAEREAGAQGDRA